MILKKKKINPEYLDEDALFLKIFETGIDEDIKKFLKNKYKTGNYVDQRVGYGGMGSVKKITDNKNISIFYRDNKNKEYTNISIGNIGIWNYKYKKLSKIV